MNLQQLLTKQPPFFASGNSKQQLFGFTLTEHAIHTDDYNAMSYDDCQLTYEMCIMHVISGKLYMSAEQQLKQ